MSCSAMFSNTVDLPTPVLPSIYMWRRRSLPLKAMGVVLPRNTLLPMMTLDIGEKALIKITRVEEKRILVERFLRLPVEVEHFFQGFAFLSQAPHNHIGKFQAQGRFDEF